MFLGLCALSSPAAAQGDIVTPNETQIQLYSEGAQAFQAEDYPKAIRLFKASLDLGELNITHLNLGRAYFKNGECALAQTHFALAEKAPKIAEPTPAQVQSKIDEYRKDLAECPGTLIVSCTPASIQVEIDGDSPVPCDGKPLTLKPGKHVVIGQLDGKNDLKKVDIVAMQETSVALEIAVPKGADPIAEPSGEGDGLALAGWVTLGAGGAVLLGAVLYDTLGLLPDYNRFDELNTKATLNEAELSERATLKSDLETGQIVVRAMLGVGVAAAATGVVLVLLSDDGGSERASTTDARPLQLGVWADGQQAGVGVGGVW